KTSRFENHRIQDVIGNTLAAKGFYEIMTNSLVPMGCDAQREAETIAMLNPLSMDLSVLRTSMLSSGLQIIGHNINRQKNDLKLFEFGKTYHKLGGDHRERGHLALFITGQRRPDSWTGASSRTDFYYLKGIVQTLLERLGIGNLGSEPLEHQYFVEGLCYTLAGKPLATFVIVAKGMLKKFDLKQEVLYAGMEWDAVLAAVDDRNIVFREI